MNLPDRWIVFDTETTGTTPSRDRIVSFGAVAIENSIINPEDSFECVVRIPYNSSAVVVHGITKEQADREGIEEAEAVERFAKFIGDACLVGHHVAFDVIVVNHANVRHGIPIMSNGAVDLMQLVMAMEDRKLIKPRANATDFSLDGLLDHFHVGKSGRHTAMGDAFLTAMIFLQLLQTCKRRGPDVLEGVIDSKIGLGNS
jgi:DNA polymerase-3 subunit epsilon